MTRSLRILMTTLSVSALFFALLACEGSYVQKKMMDAMGKKETAAPQPPPPPPIPLPPPPPVSPVTPPAPSQPTAENPPLAVPPPGTATQGGEDKAKTEEINRYIACINRTMPRTKDSMNRYLSWVDAKAGPNCKEPYITYGLYTLYEDGVKKCQDAATLGASSGPSLPTLEKGAAEMAAAYGELVPLVQKAEDYYQQQDYKDDACAKGKEMHPKLMNAFNRYFTAYNSMKGDLSVMKDQMDRAELDKIEKEQGKKLPWYIHAFAISAKSLMDSVPEGNPMQMNAQDYIAKFANVDRDFEAMSTYASANSAEGSSLFWYSAFESSAKDFFKNAKFLKRDLADGKKATPSQINDLVNGYNRLIGDLNNIHGM